MNRFALACGCAFTAGLTPAIAQTAPPTPATAATAPSPEVLMIAEALSKATSFRVRLDSPSGFEARVTVVLLPQKRSKAIATMGTTANEMVMAGGRMYVRTNDSPWTVTDAPVVTEFGDAVLKAMADPSKLRALPDRVEGGTPVSAYEVTPPLPPGAPAGVAVPPLSCTYDKTTHLLRTCTIQSMTQTYEGWNDPANVVDVPVVAPPAAPPSSYP